MSKHTPGRWQRNIPPATKYVTVFTGRNTHIFDVIPSRGITPEEAEANLDLIVAAPDLLDALRFTEVKLIQMLDESDGGMMALQPYVEMLDTIRAAIARATQ